MLTIVASFVSFILGLILFIAVMCIWGSTSKMEKYLLELLQYERMSRNLDPLTGLPKIKR